VGQLTDKIKKDLVRGVTASWKVWPLVHVINFRFIPSQQRLLYINSIQVRPVRGLTDCCRLSRTRSKGWSACCLAARCLR